MEILRYSRIAFPSSKMTTTQGALSELKLEELPPASRVVALKKYSTGPMWCAVCKEVKGDLPLSNPRA